MRVPDWYALLLLAFAAFRVYRLIAEDTILDRPRAWILGLSGWQEGKPTPKGYRAKWGEFITCGWCMGAHVSLVFWIGYQIWPHGTLVFAAPWAISLIVGIITHALNDK